jgi:hypothetical protein
VKPVEETATGTSNQEGFIIPSKKREEKPSGRRWQDLYDEPEEFIRSDDPKYIS